MRNETHRQVHVEVNRWLGIPTGQPEVGHPNCQQCESEKIAEQKNQRADLKKEIR